MTRVADLCRGSLVRSFSFFNYVNALSGIEVPGPIAYQFWFIRDLMALIVFAPAIHFFLARRTALPFVFALSCLWLFALWPPLWPSVMASSFFCLGAYLSRPGINVAYLDKFGPWISLMFCGLLFLNSAYPDSPEYLGRLAIVFGMPSIWWLAGLAAGKARLKSLLIRLSSASFFVFAAHEPWLTIIRKVSYKLLSPTSGVAILALYLLIPICLVALLVVLHSYLLSTVPTFLGFITGSSYRSNKQRA
jgi:hypothetical protein